MSAIRDTRPASSPLALFDADELLALSRHDLKKGDLCAALEKLKAVIAADRVPAGAYSLCGHLYLQLELPERAQQMFHKHLQLHPGAADEMFLLGTLHQQAGRIAEALQCWDELLLKTPSHAPALLYRAHARSQRGQVAEARADVEVLMKSTPVEHPYFKPATELLQHLNSRYAAAPASMPAVPYANTTLANSAYRAEPRQ